MIEWSAEQQRLREAAVRMGAALSGDDLGGDRDGEFPWGQWKTIRASGLLATPFATEWGGKGHDLLTMMYALEGLGYSCRDFGLAFSVVTHIVSTGVSIQRFGSDELRSRFLPAVCEGSLIGAHAITEPQGGSDMMGMETTAVEDGDHFVLNGQKVFITNAPIADLLVVYARTDAALGPFGISAFVVERSTPGLSVGPAVDKMGLRSSPISEVFLEDCVVPREHLIGKPGGGFPLLDHVMKWEILCSFIAAVGQMQHRLERCIAEAGTRTQFGQAIGTFQSISNQIVDMKIGVETSRRWLYDTAERFLNNENVTIDVAISKLVASESNVASALAAVQIFGGRGYLTETGLEEDVRDAIAGRIYSGTSEVQRQRVAKMLGLSA